MVKHLGDTGRGREKTGAEKRADWFIRSGKTTKTTTGWGCVRTDLVKTLCNSGMQIFGSSKLRETNVLTLSLCSGQHAKEKKEWIIVVLCFGEQHFCAKVLSLYKKIVVKPTAICSEKKEKKALCYPITFFVCVSWWSCDQHGLRDKQRYTWGGVCGPGQKAWCAFMT